MVPAEVIEIVALEAPAVALVLRQLRPLTVGLQEAE
jgi:hypothetical protein